MHIAEIVNKLALLSKHLEMGRIKINSRVSTEAWQFDGNTSFTEDRWSYSKFGKRWRDSRIVGTVVGSKGNKWEVRWDIDDSITTCETNYLVLCEKNESVWVQKEGESFDKSDSESEMDDDVPDKNYVLQSNAASESEDFSSSAADDTLEVQVNKQPSRQEENKSNKSFELADLEEVYLCSEGRKLFRAQYSFCPIGSTVHHKQVAQKQGRFLIKEILQDATKWSFFDEDIHMPGSFILWCYTDVTKVFDIGSNFTPDGSHAEQPTPLAEKKRKRNSDKWQRNKRKRALNKGIIKPGEVLPEDDKQQPCTIPSSSCSDKCRLQCTKNISSLQRHQICNEFYKLDSWALKTAFITERVKEEQKTRERKRKTTKSGKRRNRLRNLIYTFRVAGATVRVCKTYFLQTLNISHMRVRYAVSNKRSEVNTPQADLRGGARHVTDPNAEHNIISHIKSFDVVESHYRKKDCPYQFLCEDLTKTEMYRLYIEWCRINSKSPQKKWLYFNVFDTRFNLKFNRPQKDACDTCTSYKNLSQEQKTDAIEREQAEHLAEKDKARNFKMPMKEKSTSHCDIVSAAFDVQKVMLLPHRETSSFYYTRRLRVTNFTITKLNSMDIFCFLWHEGEAKKGSCEVASCLFQFLKKLHLDGIKEVHLFSDRCVDKIPTVWC